jgi:hypothetical protein
MTTSEVNSASRPHVLLLDDSVKSVNGKPESTLQSFAERLANLERFVCFAPPMVDDRSRKVVNLTDAEAADFMLDKIREHSIDAVVLDANWWQDELFGMRLWKTALDSGRLQLSNSRVVFVSMFLDESGISRYIRELSLDRRQVVYRLQGEGGFDTAAKWLRQQFGE